jgi:hypothetical protein
MNTGLAAAQPTNFFKLLTCDIGWKILVERRGQAYDQAANSWRK